MSHGAVGVGALLRGVVGLGVEFRDVLVLGPCCAALLALGPSAGVGSWLAFTLDERTRSDILSVRCLAAEWDGAEDPGLIGTGLRLCVFLLWVRGRLRGLLATLHVVQDVITRRRFIKAVAAALGMGAAGGIYVWRVEPHWLAVVERGLGVVGLPRDLVGWRLVQLSDLHIGPRVDDGYLMRCFQRVRELDPEFVVYTGDFTTYHAGVFDHAGRMFPQLPLGRVGTFGILGNHDYGLGWSQAYGAERLAALAAGAGVRMLRNEAAEFGGLHFVGMDDLWAGRFDPLAAFRDLPAGAAAIALSHNPDTADLPGWGDYRGWILSGHTHGGQCKPPFLPPPLLPVRNRRYTSGEFGLPGGRRLYVSRGVGHLLRVRCNVRPEITAFRLTRP